MKIFKKIIISTLCVALMFTFVACGSGSDTGANTNNADDSENVSHPQVKVTVKDFGEFTLELYPEYAPETVEHFLELVESGFYTGSTFHRVVDEFMAQGGQSATGKTAKTVKGEFKSNGFDKNTLSHTRGVISMARADDKNSATSQFFICYTDRCSYLDGDYAAFGKVIDGMDVVDKFATVERSMNSIGEKAVPVEDIVIESMQIQTTETAEVTNK